MYNTRMPQKVLDRAVANGMEDKCIKAGPGNACTNCTRIAMEAFGHFYDSFESPRVAILQDLMRENR